MKLSLSAYIILYYINIDFKNYQEIKINISYNLNQCLLLINRERKIIIAIKNQHRINYNIYNN